MRDWARARRVKQRGSRQSKLAGLTQTLRREEGKRRNAHNSCISEQKYGR